MNYLRSRHIIVSFQDWSFFVLFQVVSFTLLHRRLPKTALRRFKNIEGCLVERLLRWRILCDAEDDYFTLVCQLLQFLPQFLTAGRTFDHFSKSFLKFLFNIFTVFLVKFQLVRQF